jgi:hypothetical protein
MHSVRQSAIAVASSARRWGLILGTLGRQGNTNILDRLETILKEKQLPYVIVLLSEIFPDKLAKFTEVEASVAISFALACFRFTLVIAQIDSLIFLSLFAADPAGGCKWLVHACRLTGQLAFIWLRSLPCVCATLCRRPV